MPSPRRRWAALAGAVGGVRRTPRRWRWGAVATACLAGGLLVTSALNAHGLDLRAASVTDLDTVVRQERAHADALQNRVAELNREVSRLAHRVGGAKVSELQGKVDRRKGAAGFAAVDGAGVTVTLEDAPKSEINKVIESGKLTADALLVHQQDIQAVVNALWRGGAEAVSLQGQRVISTTGIKCVGNSVVLHGVPYSPPYVISAVGDPTQLSAALDDSAYIQAYLTFVQRYQLGWSLAFDTDVHIPAYDGSTELRYAKPLADSAL